MNLVAIVSACVSSEQCRIVLLEIWATGEFEGKADARTTRLPFSFLATGVKRAAEVFMLMLVVAVSVQVKRLARLIQDVASLALLCSLAI